MPNIEKPRRRMSITKMMRVPFFRFSSVGGPRRRKPKIFRMLRKLMLQLFFTLLAGTAVLFMIAKHTNDTEISFTGDLATALMSSASKGDVLDENEEDLDIPLQDIKEFDKERRIEQVLILNSHYKVLAVKLARPLPDDPSRKVKFEAVLKKEKALMNSIYETPERLKGLVEGTRKLDEGNGWVTIAKPVTFGKGVDEKVHGYVLFTFNQKANIRARNLLFLGLLAMALAIFFIIFRVNRLVRVAFQFTNWMAAEGVLAGVLSKHNVIRAIVGHIDFVDSTRKNAKSTPEEMVERTDKYLNHNLNVLGDWGATVDKIQGDGILWLIKIQPDMDKRVCAKTAALIGVCLQYINRAAYFISCRYQGDNIDMNIRVGEAVDTCVEATVGNNVRKDRTLYGMVVNMSVRIEGSSDEDPATRISGYLWGDSGGEEFLKSTKLEINAKGFEKPLTVHHIEGINDPVELRRVIEYVRGYFCMKKDPKYLTLAEKVVEPMLRYFRLRSIRRKLKIGKGDYNDFLERMERWLSEAAKQGLPLPPPAI